MMCTIGYGNVTVYVRIRCFKITLHLRLNQVVTILKLRIFLNEIATKLEFSDLRPMVQGWIWPQ